MPSGRGAFIERMDAMLAEAERLTPKVLTPEEAFVADLIDRHGDNLLFLEARPGRDGRPNLLAVLDLDIDALAAETARCAALGELSVEVIDKAAWLAMRRLAASGLLSFTHQGRMLHRSAALADETARDGAAPGAGRAAGAAEAMARADRAFAMAKLLAGGDFAAEALEALAKVTRQLAAALLANRGEAPADEAGASDTDIARLVDDGALAADALSIMERVGGGLREADRIDSLIVSAGRVLAEARRNEPTLMAA
jgi:hypothetical protein